MPSARSRAVTSADDPAGNSTVISITPFCGNGGSCCAGAMPAKTTTNAAASAIRVKNVVMTTSRSILGENFRDLDAAAFTCRQDAGPHHRERRRSAISTHFRLAFAAHGGGEFLQLFDEGIVLGARHVYGVRACAFDHP